MEYNRKSPQELKNFREKFEIKRWFRENDYIELQKIKGVIDENSKKYQDYITEYTAKLQRYRELKGGKDD